VTLLASGTAAGSITWLSAVAPSNDGITIAAAGMTTQNVTVTTPAGTALGASAVLFGAECSGANVSFTAQGALARWAAA
jgi:hypothetical protein